MATTSTLRERHEDKTPFAQLCCAALLAMPTPLQGVTQNAVQHFLDAQKALADKLFQSDYAKSSPRAMAHTQDYYFSLVETALENADRMAQAETPVLTSTTRYIAKPGMFNPDNRYLTTFLQPGRAYAFDVKRSTETQVILQFMKSYALQTLGPTGPIIDLSDVKPGETRTIYLGGPKRDKDWYPADPDIKSVTIRQTFSDWNATPSDITVRALSDEIPVTRPETGRLELAADNLRKITALWVDGLTPYRSRPVNAANAPGLTGAGGLKGQRSLMFQYDLKPDETLIVTCKADEAPYQGIQLGAPWFVTPDWATHQVSLNPAQTSKDADGNARFVVSLAESGVPNWLDPAGEPKGFVFLRWQGVAGPLTPPTVKLVKLADLPKELPTGTPTLSPAERQAQISARRHHPAMR